MQIFKNKKNSLIPIKKDSFKSEKDIQKLVEANLEVLFDLDLVCSEFSIAGFRLDSLAFDQQSKSFVIIEYKKGHSYSVIDQGSCYFSTMLENQAEFVLEYNSKTGKQLEKSNVDWASSRVIFVSPSFNTYQRNIVNIKNFAFCELWEIKKFEHDLVAVEQCKPSSSKGTENPQKHDSSSLITKIPPEVKILSEEDHVDKLDESMRQIWETLKEKLCDYPETSFSHKAKYYISWKIDSKVICFIHFHKKELKINVNRGSKKRAGEISKGFFTLDDPKELAKENSWKWKSGNTGHQYTISLKKAKDINYVVFLLEQKYDLLS